MVATQPFRPHDSQKVFECLIDKRKSFWMSPYHPVSKNVINNCAEGQFWFRKATSKTFLRHPRELKINLHSFNDKRHGRWLVFAASFPLSHQVQPHYEFFRRNKSVIQWKLQIRDASIFWETGQIRDVSKSPLFPVFQIRSNKGLSDENSVQNSIFGF